MTEKTWKIIPNTDGRMSASQEGEIRDNIKERILHQWTHKRWGYRICSIKNKHVRAHRLVAMAFHPNPENKPDVNHKNGIKTDNREINLEWATRSENMTHAYKTGLSHSGENHYAAKRSDEFIRTLRSEHQSGISQSELSRKYSMDRSMVSQYILGKLRNSA